MCRCSTFAHHASTSCGSYGKWGSKMPNKRLKVHEWQIAMPRRSSRHEANRFLGNKFAKRIRQRELSKKQSIKPLPGSIHPQMVTCGKACCRCAGRGHLHGPYHYRFFRERGRQRKVYIRSEKVSEAREATRLWKDLHPATYKLLASLRGLSAALRILTQGAQIGK